MKKIDDKTTQSRLLLSRRHTTKLLVGAATALSLPTFFTHPAAAQASAERLAEMLKAGPNGDRVLGQPDAPVTIIEYASMTCPHCAAFHGTILPVLKEKYIDAGKAKLIFREFPLDDLALIVALLARCVEGDTYFGFLDILFKQQRNWAAAPKAQLLKLSKQVGISEAGFDKCIANQKILNGIGWERDRAKNEFDVNSTPTVFVNGQKMDAGASVEDFGKVIDAAL